MNRIFERCGKDEKESYLLEKIKICVTGCGSGSGASFAALSIAYHAARLAGRNTAFVQMDGVRTETMSERQIYRHDIYDSAGMDKRFRGREFADFFSMLSEGKQIRGVKNIDSRINWAVEIPHRDGYERRKLDALDYMRLVNNIDGDIVVCDFGSFYPDRCISSHLYEDMDTIVAVIDPMPSKLLESSGYISFLRMLEMKGYKVIWILNKDNPGVNRREIRDFLGTGVTGGIMHPGKMHTVPLLSPVLFYVNQYNCQMPQENRQIREKTGEIFEKIVKDAVVNGMK